MTYQEKLEGAIALIQAHNEAIGQNDGKPNPGFIDPAEFTTYLKAAGYHTNDRLTGMSQEDILELLPAYKNIKPKVLAKDISKIFRDKPGTLIENSENRPVSGKKAANMTFEELVKALDVEDPTSPVATRLKNIVNNKAFIVFTTGRTIDVETTLKLLNELRSGYQEVEITNVGGTPKQVYKLGQLPDNFADENPLYHKRPLRPDGTCDQLQRSWAGVSLPVRQLIYLAVKNGAIDVSVKNGIMIAHDIMNLAIVENAQNQIRTRYPKIALDFDKLAQTSGLPTLKVVLGQPGSVGARPFDGGRRVEWAK